VLLVRESFDPPALDMAVSAALLERVAAGSLPEVLRVHAHRRPVVAFGRRDTFLPGYPAALRAAADHGCAAIERLAGGRAAVYHQGTIEVDEVVADPDAAVHLRERFAAAADVLAGALRALGVDARIGAVAGEYCPGEFSLNARGARKLSGTAQRVVRTAAFVGTVLVVRDAAQVAAVVGDVYGALGLDVSPQTSGAVEDEVPGVTTAAVEQAVLAAYAVRGPLEPLVVDAELLERARALQPRYEAPAA
jgi:lipoate-protein ligase A